MARNAEEKILSADLDSELVDRFCQQVETRGFKKKRALKGAVELWMSLPAALQAYILGGECGEDVLEGLLKYIIGDQMDSLRKEFHGLRAKPQSGTGTVKSDPT